MTTTADWDEIKRLAADFQKAQLSSTVQRLSERNCIEIVTKLIELKLIDVIFTTDGKEYLTHQELVKEIKDELFVRGGRVNTVDLAKELMVDLSQINASVIEIVRNKDVLLVSGYLISSSYIEKIAREINEKILQLGQINVGDLTLQYDLPADLLLHNVLERNLGKIIQARQDPADPRTFYTEDFITRAKAKIRGAVMGLLRPTPVTVIINQCNVSERLFHLLFDQINAPGALTGRQSGAQYVPHCYTKSQVDWVTSFFKQNDYLEYDALSRLGISDPKTFIRRNVNSENLLFLDSCAVGSRIKDQIDTALEECIATKSFIDIVSLLPSVFNNADIQSMLELLLKNNQKSTVLFEDTVVSTFYLDKLIEKCMPMVKIKAERVVEDGSYQKFYIDKQLQSKSSHETQQSQFVDLKAERREERRRKATSGKAGGGTQGREVKTKSTKKHQRGGKHNIQDSDDEEQNTALNKKSTGNLQIVNVDDVESQLLENLEEEGIEDLNAAIATHILPDLNQAALTIAKSICDKKLQNASQSRKQTHSSAQDKINILTNDIRLYEKGIKMFNAEQQPQFLKYLLKTFGGDIATEFCIYAANQCNLQVPSENLTVEQRNKIINDVTDEYKKPLQALTSSLFDQNTEVFFQALESCLSTCGMILKKVDKKKDRIILHNHKEKLLEELSNTEDPALALHLAVLVIFTNVTQTMLHASGRQVPTILTFLKSHLADEDRNTLSKYHDLVTKYLVSNDDKKMEVEEDLKSEISKIKILATEYKKADKRDVSGE